MIYKLAELITNKLCKYNYYSLEEIEKIDYGLKVILGEAFKLIILFVLFLSLGKVNFFIISLLILMSIRPFAGGLHFNSALKCLAFTTSFFILTSYLAPNTFLQLDTLTFFILGVIITIIIAIKSPNPNPNRPITNKKRRGILKGLSIFFTITWLLIIFYYIKDTKFINCGISTLLLQSIQLLKFNGGYTHARKVKIFSKTI